MEQLRETVPNPEEWGAYEIYEGRFLFSHRVDENTREYSWKRPDTKLDFSAYKPLEVIHGDPKYEALSYKWGSDSNRRCIAVEGCSEGRRLKNQMTSNTKLTIRANLFAALQHLRLSNATRIL